MPAGRPSKYTPELVDSICQRIALGESLNKICSDADMPNMSSIFKWLGEHPEFSNKYARAKEEQGELMADQIIALADNAEDVNKARLQIDARKWVAAKLKPKKYGDKVQTEHTGPDGGPIQISRIELIALDGR